MVSSSSAVADDRHPARPRHRRTATGLLVVVAGLVVVLAGLYLDLAGSVMADGKGSPQEVVIEDRPSGQSRAVISEQGKPDIVITGTAAQVRAGVDRVLAPTLADLKRRGRLYRGVGVALVVTGVGGPVVWMVRRRRQRRGA